MFFCCPSSSRTLHLRAQLWHTAPFRPNTLQLCYARPLQRPQVMAVPLAEFSGCRCVAWQSPSCSRCEWKINGAGIVKGTRKEGRMEGCPKPKKMHEIYQFSSHINLHFISVFKTKNPSRVVFCCTSSPSQMVFIGFSYLFLVDFDSTDGLLLVWGLVVSSDSIFCDCDLFLGWWLHVTRNHQRLKSRPPTFGG